MYPQCCCNATIFCLPSDTETDLLRFEACHCGMYMECILVLNGMVHSLRMWNVQHVILRSSAGNFIGWCTVNPSTPYKFTSVSVLAYGGQRTGQ